MKLKFSLLLIISVTVVYAQDLKIPIDTAYVTTHTVNIKGQQVNYRAETGFQPAWNDEGKLTASLYYTYYNRTNDKKGNQRPLVFSFNGGPGSASVWMHIAYTGPKVLNIDDEGYPVQPYG
ncbi:MAG: carboxypeptidase, partial [Winogradskyella sp.]|nr:carboxypeptidase [Winogradskyella sp.]